MVVVVKNREMAPPYLSYEIPNGRVLCFRTQSLHLTAEYSYFVGGELRRNSAIRHRQGCFNDHIATSFGFVRRLASGFEKCERRAINPNQGQINLCLVITYQLSFLLLNMC